MSGSCVAANRSAAGRGAARGGRLFGAVAVGCLGLVSAPAAIAQVAVQLHLQANAPQMMRLVGPQADGGGDAIGDPWWDEAETKRPAAAPVAGEPEQVDEPQGPADAAEMARQHLQAEAEAVAQTLRLHALGILRRELSLVRQTCPSLERQQRAIVLEAGRGAIDRSVEEQFQAVLGGRLRPGGAGRRSPGKPTDVEKAIRDAVLASAKANATDAEAAAYEAEHRFREDRRKAAVVAALVAEVDRAAYLDDAERQALGKTLTESYRDRWRPAVARLEQGMAVSDESNLPGLERCVEKALGKPRKAEWIAARDEARKLAGQAGMAMSHEIIEQAVPGGRRVIRREVRVNDKAVLQLDVGVGVADAEAPPPPAEGAPEEDAK